MEIKPTDLTIKRLLESSFYKIPRFQRPYSWDRENVEDFWNDAIASDHEDYFIGSFVVYTSKDHFGPLYLVDGQQRLTTITLLLAATRDAFDSVGEPDKAKGVQQLIERPDMNAERQFVLQTETSYPYLQEHIQKHGAPDLAAKGSSEESSLSIAYSYLRNLIDGGLRGIDKQSAHSPTKKRAQKVAYLTGIRDKVLRLQLIQIQLANENDAYLIFETLNTRGKDLQVSDLAKNHLARLLRPKTKGVDVVKDKWALLTQTLDSSKVDFSVDRFVHHSWLSRRWYIGEKELFSAIKDHVTKSTAKDYLDELVADASLYRTVFEPEYRTWSKQEYAVRNPLRALQIFRVAQPTPMVMSIVRAWERKTLTLAQASQALRTLEHFHFQFTAVTSQRTGGGTAKMYALAARQVSDAVDKNAAAQVLKEFVGKLRERVPTEAEFRASFVELKFSAQLTKQKPLVRYALERFDSHFRSGAPADYDRFSIEHIAPQRPASGAPVVRMPEIGNLLLVPEKLNEKLANLDFDKKKKALLAAGVHLDPVLKAATSWGDDEIERRSDWLASEAYNKVFKV